MLEMRASAGAKSPGGAKINYVVRQGPTNWPPRFRVPRGLEDEVEIARLRKDHEFQVCEALFNFAKDEVENYDPVWIFEQIGWTVGMGAQALVAEIAEAHHPDDRATVQAAFRAPPQQGTKKEAERFKQLRQYLILFLGAVLREQRQHPDQDYLTRRARKSQAETKAEAQPEVEVQVQVQDQDQDRTQDQPQDQRRDQDHTALQTGSPAVLSLPTNQATNAVA